MPTTTFDLPYITRKWKDCQLPKIKSLNIFNECIEFMPDSLYMELDICDVWTLHSYLLNNFGTTLSISKVKNYWKIKFSSSSVMSAFMDWISVNSSIFLSHIPVTKKPSSVDCHVSLDKSAKESFVVFFANTMALGNITDESYAGDTNCHYKFRPAVSHESLSCFFLQESQHDAVSFSSVSMKIHLTHNMISIYIRLLRQTYPTWFRIDIPFHFLVPGNILLQENALEKTPGFFNVAIYLRLLCAPFVYRQPYIGKSEILDSPDKTPDLSLQWVRDFNPNTQLHCSPRMAHLTQDHPLSALQESWCICLTRGSLPNTTLARFKKCLYRVSLLRKSCNIGVTLLPPYSHLHEKQFQKYMKKLKYYRPRHIVHLIIALISRGAIPDPLCLSLDPQLQSLCKPKEYSDTLIFDTLNRAFIKFQHSYLNCNFASLYQRCLKYCSSVETCNHSKITVPKNLQFSITITPFKIYLIPEYEWLENRVIRTFNEKELDFFRVNFRDEACNSAASSDNSDHLILRIKNIINNGIVLYSWKLKLFGYSQSQLKSAGCWFVHQKKKNADIAVLLESFGNFSAILETGKMVSRLGLLFSSAISFVGLEENQFILIDDIVSLRNFSNPSLGCYNFTDGVGFCSPKFLQQVQICQSLDFLPSAIQIRYKGFKGMLCCYPEWFKKKWTHATSYNAKTISVVFRMSMQKFIAKHTSLDILAYSSYRPSRFNKQILLALDSLGVNWNIFLDLLNKQFSFMTDSRTTTKKAIQFLQSVSCRYDHILLLRCLLNNNISINEPFIQSCLKLLIEVETRLVIESGWIYSAFCCNLFGVADESGTLKYDHGNGLPEVFIRLRKPMRMTSPLLVEIDYEEVILQGVVLIAKAPVLYPGDCQLCYAVNNSDLSFLENVLVFPTNIPKGTDTSCLHKSHPAHIHPNDPTYFDNSVLKTHYGFRDIPSMMSGSDLDGDQYFICWEPRIISHLVELHLKQKSIKPAGFYTTLPINAEQSFDAFLPLHERLKNHYLFALQNRSLHLIASCHMRKSHDPEIYAAGKSLHSSTIQLAYLHSEAVDAVKTARTVKMRHSLKNVRTPHFHTRQVPWDRYPLHKSVSLLGKIYDKATQCANFVFSDTERKKKKITFLRYERTDSVTEENANIGFYWLRLEWKLSKLACNDSSMISYIYVYEYDQVPFTMSFKTRLFHCPVYVNSFDVCVLHKPGKTQYITFNVNVDDTNCCSKNVPVSLPVITLKDEEQVISHSKDNSEDALECYTCLYLYNSPYMYGTDLLSFVAENITPLLQKPSKFDIHIIDSFTQMSDVNNPAKIYNDPKNIENKLNHFKMIIQSEQLHIENLLLELTGSPPIALGYSFEYLPSDISLCKLSSRCSTFVSTHPLEICANLCLQMFSCCFYIKGVAKTDDVNAVSFYSHLYQHLTATDAVLPGHYPLILEAFSNDQERIVKLCFECDVDKMRVFQKIPISSFSEVWDFQVEHNFNSPVEPSWYDIDACSSSNSQSFYINCKNEKEFFEDLDRTSPKSCTAIKALRRVICYFPITFEFLEECFQPIRQSESDSFLNYSLDTVLHTITLYIHSFIKTFQNLKCPETCLDTLDLINDIIFSSVTRSLVENVHEAKPSSNLCIFGSVLIITKSAEASRILLENSFFTHTATDASVYMSEKKTFVPACHSFSNDNKTLYFLPVPFNEKERFLVDMKTTRNIHCLNKEEMLQDELEKKILNSQILFEEEKLVNEQDSLHVFEEKFGSSTNYVLKRFPVLKTTRLDPDLVHPFFTEAINVITPYLDDFLEKRNLIKTQFNMSNETSLLLGIGLNDKQRKTTDTKEHIQIAFSNLVKKTKISIARLLLLKTEEERIIIASAAYVLNHQRYCDCFANTSLSDAFLKETTLSDKQFDATKTSSLSYSHSFCWLFFSLHLISLKHRRKVLI